jgi:type I restriction enzyme, S subunit
MALTKSLKEIIAEDKTGLLAKHPTWERVLLADVVRVLNGFPFESERFNSNQGMPLIRIRDVLTGSSDTFYDGDFDPAFVVRSGEILVGMDGDFHVGSWGELLYSKRLLQFLLPGYLSAIHAQTSSVTVKHLSSRSIQEIELPLPPAAEQTRIVAKLEELLSSLDAGVAELKAAQKKLVQYRQSLLKAAVEGTLTKAWRDASPASETGSALLARILKERRARWEAKQLAKFAAQGKAPPKDWEKKYPEPAKPDTTGLATLPAGWVWATVEQLAHVGTGVTPLRSKPAYFEGGTTPWVTSGALNDEFVTSANEAVSELALKECRLEVYPVGSLLVAMYGEGKTRGKCSELMIPATINQAIAALVLESEAQNCKAYLKVFLLNSYEKMREQASGGVQPNLNLLIVKSIALPLPSVAEQNEIIRQLSSLFEQIDAQQIAVEHSLKQSAAQRKNILQAAFAGRLVAQDPSDEPAGVLLARVAKEREKAAQLKLKLKAKT